MKRVIRRLGLGMERIAAQVYILFHCGNQGGVAYYESIKRELQTKLIYECRYDERIKTKVEESTRLGYTVLDDKTN